MLCARVACSGYWTLNLVGLGDWGVVVLALGGDLGEILLLPMGAKQQESPCLDFQGGKANNQTLRYEHLGMTVGAGADGRDRSSK